MKELFNELNNSNIASKQKENGITKRAMKKRLSKYNFKEIASDQSKKPASYRSGSHSLAALQLFQNSK